MNTCHDIDTFIASLKNPAFAPLREKHAECAQDGISALSLDACAKFRRQVHEQIIELAQEIDRRRVTEQVNSRKQNGRP